MSDLIDEIDIKEFITDKGADDILSEMDLKDIMNHVCLEDVVDHFGLEEIVAEYKDKISTILDAERVLRLCTQV